MTLYLCHFTRRSVRRSHRGVRNRTNREYNHTYVTQNKQVRKINQPVRRQSKVAGNTAQADSSHKYGELIELLCDSTRASREPIAQRLIRRSTS